MKTSAKVNNTCTGTVGLALQNRLIELIGQIHCQYEYRLIAVAMIHSTFSAPDEKMYK